MIENHHEYINGSGYYHKKIRSLPEQVLSLVEIFSALTEKRWYRDRFSNEKVMEQIEDYTRKGKFDKNLVSVLFNLVKEQDWPIVFKKFEKRKDYDVLLLSEIENEKRKEN